MNYCTNCGAKLIDNSNFCQSCGNKLLDTPTPDFKTNEDTITEVKKEEIKQEINQNKLHSTEDVKSNIIAEKPKNNYTKIIVVISIVLVSVMAIAIFVSTNQNSNTVDNGNSQTSNSNDNLNEDKINSNVQSSNADESPQSGSQEDEITQRNIYLRNNWASFITADRSEYTYAEIGGISGLSIIVTNNTEYKLENVTVKVTIKTVNNYVYKTEMLYFENIKPNSKVEQYVTPTDRGRYVEYEITNIYSDRLNFMWNKGDNTGNGSIDDPWKFNN